MPDAPKKPCRSCKQVLTKETYCPVCFTKFQSRQKATRQQYDRRRGTTAGRGYDADWQKVRLERKVLAKYLCECDRCKAMGRVRAVTMSDPVHHIKPVETHPHLRLDINNLRSHARICHEVEEGRARDLEYEQWKRNVA